MVDNIEAVKQVLADIDAAWDNGDADAFAAQWTTDGTVISPMGEVTEGRANIQKDMTEQFGGAMQNTTHDLVAEKIYVIGDDAMMVDGEAAVAMPGQDPWKSRFSAVLGRDQDGKWAMYHMRSYIYIQQ